MTVTLLPVGAKVSFPNSNLHTCRTEDCQRIWGLINRYDSWVFVWSCNQY